MAAAVAVGSWTAAAVVYAFQRWLLDFPAFVRTAEAEVPLGPFSSHVLEGIPGDCPSSPPNSFVLDSPIILLPA